MKKIIIWLAKVFHVELPKAEVIKEYKWIPLDGKITGNVEVTGNLTATGYITARGSDSEIIALYEGNAKFRASWYKKSFWRCDAT